MNKTMPAEQQRDIKKAKNKIALLIRSRKIIHMPEDKLCCEIMKMALDELIMEHPVSDITFYQSLKHYKKQFMESM